jgi:acyl transferase domain-containing protein/acyl carrier protein
MDEVDRIAVVGMAGRFPGAAGPDELWELLCRGESGLTRFTREELRAEGVPAELLDSPNYVPVKGVLDDVAGFDATLFGYSAAEAAVLDPQQRLLLEVARTALEDAGCDPRRVDGAVGVYAAGMLSSYLIHNLLPRTDLLARHGLPMLYQANQPDQLAARVAYKLGLTGPAVTVQTACSSSLVAVHLAAQSLLAAECDVALAGGVSVTVPHRVGYLAADEGIESPDGRCQPFSADANGTVFSNGVGVVVLKRLSDALADGDRIHAVLLGSAVNNDGRRKVGFTAPSVQGQAAVLADALAMADVEPSSIGYVEAHGTGTAIGDPIEVAALNQVYGGGDHRCALGSVKANLGHLDTAAGVTGLIRAVLSLRHGRIPALPHAEKPHPDLGLADGPFFLPEQAQDWPVDGPRRAAVSAFGIGGTNAHVVLEEAPPTTRPADADGSDADGQWLPLPLSAATPTALATLADGVRACLPHRRAADVAYTLRTGRTELEHRSVLVGAATVTGRADVDGAQVAFLLPGQGTQYAGMGRELYDAEPAFRAAVDECVAHLPELREWLWSAEKLTRTDQIQPAVFTISYALAKLWQEWGVTPAALLGHSLGEYTAACLAGVFSLGDALALVAERGRLMAGLAPGAMIAVAVSEHRAAEVAAAHGLDVAAVNGPASCVLSGPPEAVAAASGELTAQGEGVVALAVDRAFHSRAMDDVAAPLAERLGAMTLRAPSVPVLSNLTGTWLTAEEATDPGYWVRQMRQPVRFAEGLRTLAELGGRTVLVETGPGGTLTRFAEAAGLPELRWAPPTLSARGEQPERVAARLAFGGLWAHGAAVDWARLGDAGRITDLPTYPYEHRRYWVEPGAPAASPATTVAGGATLAGFGWQPVTPPADALPGNRATWLVLADPDGGTDALVDLLNRSGQIVTCALPGDGYRRVRRGVYELDPSDPAQYERLLTDLRALVRTPTVVLHGWSLSSPDPDRGYFSLVRLARAMTAQSVVHRVRIGVLTTGAFALNGTERAVPEATMLSGPVLVLPTEYDNLSCLQLDLPATGAEPELVLRALATDGPVLALRAGQVWARRPEVRSPRPAPSPVRPGGVYVVTGGLGGIGRALAAALAKAGAGTLVLVGRRPGECDIPGVTVVFEQADVTDAEALAGAFARVRERYGRIDGVVHAAGVPGGGAVERRDDAQMRAVLAPKVDGTRNLLAALRPDEADFVVLCSSLAAVVPTYGQCDYAAANAYLDGVAQAGGDRLVLSLNWDMWAEAGMAHDADLPADLRELQRHLLVDALTTEQATRAFTDCLADGARQALVVRAGSAGPDGLTLPGTGGFTAPTTRHPRPDLATAYVAPRDELEEQLAEVWQALLGLDRVGVHDDFVQLGGHSLMAAQLIAQLRNRFGVEVPVRVLFEGGTIADLAARIEDLIVADLERS